MSSNQASVKLNSKIIRFTLFVIVLLFVVRMAYTTWVFWDLYDSVLTVQSVITSDAMHDDTQLTNTLSRLSLATQRSLGEVYNLRGIIGLFGADGCALNHLVQMGHTLSGATDELVILAPALRDSLRASQTGMVDVSLLQVALARAQLTQHAASLSRIPSGLQACPQASPQFRQYLELSDSVQYLARFLTAADWHQLLQPQHRWLIVLNNSDELRAGGGYITAVLEVTIDSQSKLTWRLINGFTVDESVENSEAVRRPPEPMERYMGFGKWMFRDGNWSPDFPTTAHILSEMYIRGQQTTPPDLVINISLTAVETVTQYLPTFTIEEGVFSPDTAMDIIRTAWNEDAAMMNSYIPNRKDFLLEVAAHIGEGVVNNISTTQAARLGLALRDLLERRDVMLYSPDEQLQAAFVAHGWDGGMRADDSDYLMIVESNLGYNKVTPKVQRTMTYTVNLAPIPNAQLDLTYTNTNPEGPDCTRFNRDPADGSVATYAYRMEGCYWNYLRVFFAPQSRITGYRAQEIQANWFEFSPVYQPARIQAQQEANIPGAGMMLVIPRAESRSAMLSYQLPTQVITTNSNSHTYHLHMQGQSGMQPTPFEVYVTLPENATLLDSNPQPTQTNGQTLLFQGVLQGKDWHFTVTYRP